MLIDNQSKQILVLFRAFSVVDFIVLASGVKHPDN